jgi:hypothetical protein
LTKTERLRENKLPETRSRPVFSGTRFKGIAAPLLFLILAFILEFLLVYSFLLLGLSDKNAWTNTLQFPGTNFALTITVSPLFHLLPVAVLIVLVSSWLYLAKTYTYSFAIAEKRKHPPPSRREIESRRFKSLRRLYRRIDRRLQRVGRSIKAGFLRIPGMAGVSERLSLTKSSVGSALIVFAVFVSISFLLYIVIYPDLIRNIVVGFYEADSSRVDFVVGVGNSLRGVGGSLGVTVANGLWGAAPGFRQGLASIGASLTGSIVNFDAAGKYVLSQNAASMIVVAIALIYGWYTSIRRPRKR